MMPTRRERSVLRPRPTTLLWQLGMRMDPAGSVPSVVSAKFIVAATAERYDAERDCVKARLVQSSCDPPGDPRQRRQIGRVALRLLVACTRSAASRFTIRPDPPLPGSQGGGSRFQPLHDEEPGCSSIAVRARRRCVCRGDRFIEISQNQASTEESAQVADPRFLGCLSANCK